MIPLALVARRKSPILALSRRFSTAIKPIVGRQGLVLRISRPMPRTKGRKRVIEGAQPGRNEAQMIGVAGTILFANQNRLLDANIAGVPTLIRPEPRSARNA